MSRYLGKGVMTAERNQYRKGRNEKKKYKTWFFSTLKMRAETSSRKNLKENCRNGNVRLLRQ